MRDYRQITSGFAKGLTATFSGTSDFKKISRGTFQMASSSTDETGLSYIDQWVIGRTTGGQELLEIDGKRYTRVYAGGVISEVDISALGITHKQVLDFLTAVLSVDSYQTRFDTTFVQTDGDWTYEYIPDPMDDVLDLITGKETISYKHTIVFIHRFIISPIEV